MTNEELQKAVAVACAYWEKLELTPAKVEVARSQWLELSYAEVLAAMAILARESPVWFPGWGGIAAKAIELTHPVVESDEALAEVQRAFSQVGRYGEPEWSSPAIASTVQALGGWIRCCDMSAEHFPRQFTNLYSQCSARTKREALMPESARALVAGVAAKLRLDPVAVPALPYATSVASDSTADK